MSRSAPPSGNPPGFARMLAIGAIAAAIGFAAVYVTGGSNDNAGLAPGRDTAAPAAPPAAGPGQLAGFVRRSPPETLPAVTFLGPDGSETSLAAFKGRAVLLNLWATWCAPCRKEMPSLDRLQKELGSDAFEVVALAVDRNGVAAAKKFLDETKVANLKLYVDPTAKAGTALKAVGMPTTILIDKEGREVGRLTGPAEWDSAEAKALVAAAVQR